MIEELFFKIYKLRIVLKHSNFEHTGLNDLYDYLHATQDKTTSPEDKLNWVFDVFDKDGKESIDCQEMGDIIISLFNMSGMRVDEKKLLTHLQDMLNNLDKDCNIEINRAEFIRNAVSCFFISDLVTGKVFNRICSVPQIAPKDITVLAHKTKLTKKEIISQYKDFIAKYPAGAINRKQFIKHFKQRDEESDIHADAMFNVFDKENTGTINFLYFMLAGNSKVIKSAEDKLSWIFDVFDKNGKGFIEGNEVEEVVTGLFSIAGIRIEHSILAARMEELIEAVNGDIVKEITKAVFVKNAMKCNFVSDIINDDVVNGLSQL